MQIWEVKICNKAYGKLEYFGGGVFSLICLCEIMLYFLGGPHAFVAFWLSVLVMQ